MSFHRPPEIEAAFGPIFADIETWIPRRAQRIDTPTRAPTWC